MTDAEAYSNAIMMVALSVYLGFLVWRHTR